MKNIENWHILKIFLQKKTSREFGSNPTENIKEESFLESLKNFQNCSTTQVNTNIESQCSRKAKRVNN